MLERMVMSEGKRIYNGMLAALGLAPIEGSLVDIPYRSPDVLFQSGVAKFRVPAAQSQPEGQVCRPAGTVQSSNQKRVFPTGEARQI